MNAGVLCLQGSCEPHLQRLSDLGQSPVRVRALRHLDGLTHLIIPGGESTTIAHLLDLFELRDEIIARQRGGDLAIFGTCAGAILLGTDDGERPRRLGLLDATLSRNGYGRQVDSFTQSIDLPGIEGGAFHAVFIRAPRIVQVGDSVRVLGALEGEPILVEAPGLMAATFHPELTDDARVHEHFLTMSPAAARSQLGSAT